MIDLHMKSTSQDHSPPKGDGKMNKGFDGDSPIDSETLYSFSKTTKFSFDSLSEAAKGTSILGDFSGFFCVDLMNVPASEAVLTFFISFLGADWQNLILLHSNMVSFHHSAHDLQMDLHCSYLQLQNTCSG